MGFCYQKNTKSLFVAECGKKDFWREIRKASTAFNIDTRRAILRAVEAKDEEAMQKWAEHTDYQKFMLKTLRDLKTKTGKEKWQHKPLDKKLLAWADDLKKSLTTFQFSCYQFDEATVKTKDGKSKKGPRRLLKGCHLNGLVMLDIDHVDNPMEVWEKLQANEELMARVVLVHITSSGHGIRIIFTADKKIGNLADQQISFASVLGYTPDQSTIDATRNSFAPKEDEILFIDEERLFTYYDEDFDREFTPQYRDKKTQPLYHQFPTDNPAAGADCSKTAAVAGKAAVAGAGDVGQVDAEPVSLSFKGIPYSDIIAEWWKQNGGEPQEGERNVKLYQLAVSLRAICDNSRSLLMEVMPRLGLDEEEMRSIVESACKEPPKGISKALQRVLAVVGVSGEVERDPSATLGMTKEGVVMTSPVSGDSSTALGMTRLLWEWGAQIEALSEDYPIIKDITKGLKKNQYPAALFVAGGLLMTLMTRCTYRFYHRPEELRRLNNSTLIIGDPASGKSFATRLFKLLASPIVAADQVGKEAINAYREQMRTKGANKEKPKKPKVLVRIHPARTSNAQFIQDMVNVKEEVDGEPMQLHMLTFDTELDNTLSLQKGGAYIDKQALQLKAFHNEEDGQAYSNVDSVFQEFYVIWNYIYTGTPIALKKMVNEQNFGSGLATRLTCIPLPATKYQMMDEEETVDYESDERLKAWAEKLDRMKGELTVKSLVHELYLWTARRMADAEENDSQADEMLLKRCAYHGLNFSAPFIVMRHWDQMKQDGQFWCGSFETDEVDWRLAELIVNIQYACQRHFFGRMAETYFENKNRDASVNIRRSQKTIECFNRLPEEFTIEDVMRCFSLPIESARVRANRLVADKVAVKSGQFKENGSSKSKYRKTGVIML